MADAWEILKNLPESTHSVVNEYLMDPTSQNALGGQQNARDYLLSLLQNKGGEGMLEALLKGAGEGAIQTFVPRTALDVTQSAALTGAGALAKGAQGMKAAEEAGQAAKAARGVERVRRLNTNLRAQEGSRNLALKPGGQSGAAQKGYFGGGAKARAARIEATPTARENIRPTAEQMKMFQKADAAKPGAGAARPAGPSSFLEEQDRVSHAFNSPTQADKMAKLIEANPGAGAGKPTYVGPFSEWLTQQAAKGNPITLEEFLRYTGLP